jgi:hypothetical protein
MKPDTYYSKNREERLEYQKKHQTFCSICKNSYKNKESHFRNPKYAIIHQQHLSDALRTAK